ncbi:ArsR/SmtB family transcription factor [Spiroplasma culicicola]|uniref:ArsR family transcriptional regulator n=1 Tax=Spiroplasma culicicola AES-1 TaxID=1276246 RepID=W6A8Q9_9MOLU|nr:metalloregulator ArsR/SmtB family transcription factor [Spiroplasma culicicola]AHI53351.1 ArsR family transcriptional regulator [Spiroplasma culicicola AES-1]
METNFKEYAQIFKVLSDPTRLKILNRICGCECDKCAQNILVELNITQPTLSYHLKLLEEVGLITSTKNKNSKFYSINEKGFKELEEFFKVVRSKPYNCDNCNKKS